MSFCLHSPQQLWDEIIKKCFLSDNLNPVGNVSQKIENFRDFPVICRRHSREKLSQGRDETESITKKATDSRNRGHKFVLKPIQLQFYIREDS